MSNLLTLQEYGLVFSKELQNKNWDKIQKLLPSRELFAHDIKALYLNAVRYQQLPIISFLHTYLLEHHTFLDNQALTEVFKLAFEKNNYQLTSLVCEHPLFNFDGMRSPTCPYNLFQLTALNRLQSVHALIDKGAPVDIRADTGESFLMTVCEDQASDLVEKVLAKGVDPNEPCFDYEGHVLPSPLHCAIDLGRLVEKTKEFEEKRKTQLQIIELLFKYKANPNTLDHQGKAPFFSYHSFSKTDFTTLMTLFFDNGIDIQLKNSEGHTLEQSIRHYSQYSNSYKHLLEAFLSLRERNHFTQQISSTLPSQKKHKI